MQPPSHDPFYDWSAPVPTTPGTALRCRRVAIGGTTPCAATQLIHTTVATNGQPVAVSGTVLVPDAPWAGPGIRPTVSYGVGVHGLGRNSAPSYLLTTGREWESQLVDLALQRGWAVVITDGEGLGLPGPHTYGAGRVGGRAMLDLVRAATSEVDGVEPGAPVLLWGYSEGGRCAIWAAEHQPIYARELPLVAVAAGGIPTDLSAVVQAIDGGPYSGLGLAVLVGLAHAYGDPRLWDILNARGRAAAQVAATLDVTGLIVGHPEPLSTWTTRERPWEDPFWQAILRMESNPAGTPRVPTYLYHAAGDDIVPSSLCCRLATAYEEMGVEVTRVEVDSPDHLSGAVDGAAGAVAWLAESLAGSQARGAAATWQAGVPA